MLSPSKLFFGTPDPVACGEETLPTSTPDLVDSSDTDQRTDVPADLSFETSLNESEEDRWSPAGSVAASAAAAVVDEYPSTVAAGSAAPRLAPPGLPLLTDELRRPALVKPVLESSLVASDDSDGDDYIEGRLLANDEMGARSHNGDSSVRYSELPSIGSANHFSGNCDRCCFHPKGRCLNGFNCQHCHFDHEKRKRKNKKKNKSKTLQGLGGEDGMDMLSVTDCSSVPVSPDQPFGPGMLPDAEFTASACGTPQQASMAFMPAQQPMFYSNPPVARPPQPGVAPNLDDSSQWGKAAQLCGNMSPQDGGGFMMPPAAGYDITSQVPASPRQTLLGTAGPTADAAYSQQLNIEPRYTDKDRREDYIQQLEAENRYLRACLVQCLGPNAATVLPPMAGNQQPFARQQEGLSVLEAPMLGTPGDAVNGLPVAPRGDVQQLPVFGSCPPPTPPPESPAPLPPGFGASTVPGSMSGTAAFPTSGNNTLSPSALPFWPVGQSVWPPQHEGISGTEHGDTARFDGGARAVPLHQDAEGHIVSTSGGQHLTTAGEA